MDGINMNAGQRLEHAPGTAPQQSWRTEMQAKSTPSIPRVCEYCGGPFRTTTYLVSKGYGKFCSRRCTRRAQPPPIPEPRPLLPHPDDPTALLVPLTQGKVAIIDRADAHLVESRSWSARSKNGRWYAQTSDVRDGKRTCVEMQVVLAGVGGEFDVDHHDGDGLNNRQSNLRTATRAQNSWNQKRRPSKSGFKGVHWHPSSGLWVVRMTVQGVSKTFGYFHDPEDAARVYDAAAREHHGEFARLNFPKEREQSA
jgi:hypothetical protein